MVVYGWKDLNFFGKQSVSINLFWVPSHENILGHEKPEDQPAMNFLSLLYSTSNKIKITQSYYLCNIKINSNPFF